jgi:membrane protease YdiL (CAAX protease family)
MATESTQQNSTEGVNSSFATAKHLARRILLFPLTRIVVAMIAVSVPVVLVQIAARPFAVSEEAKLLVVCVSIVLSFLAYWGYVRLVERRTVSELLFNGGLKEIGKGALLGAGLFSTTIGVLWMTGCYAVAGWNDWSVLIASLSLSLSSGFVEELLMRGIFFRIMEESLGTWIALILSALLFGFLHAGNPNATIVSSVAIALEAGLLLGACYVLTRRLWFAIGVHMAWNFVQGGIFGVAVSGNAAKGLLQSTLAGPEILSGGSFGAEASVVAVVVCVAGFMIVIQNARRKGEIIQPFWTRR